MHNLLRVVRGTPRLMSMFNRNLMYKPIELKSIDLSSAPYNSLNKNGKEIVSPKALCSLTES